MSPEARLAHIAEELERVGIRHLVMGGHAARHYGVARYTNDFDLHLAPDSWDRLTDRLSGTALFGGREPVEGPSWRTAEFRRFRIGMLADGREEWLEFWRSNHLLAPFSEMYGRGERGEFGGHEIRFLSLSDLICSKETERDKDWDDIAVLEEFHDARLLSGVAVNSAVLANALAQLRCRRGLESFDREGLMDQAGVVAQSLALTKHSVTQALLLAFAPSAEIASADVPIEPVVLERLRTASLGSPFHMALVEIVRRQYRQARQAAYRADKERVHSQQG